jgi:hypothetical protein
MPSTADDILSYLLRCGISAIELMGDPAEQFAGAPVFGGPAWPGPGQRFAQEQRARFEWGAIAAGIISRNIALFCAAPGLKTRPHAVIDGERIRNPHVRLDPLDRLER